MVSFWPFRGDDTSAASFEKHLSQLSTKINKASALNDSFRQNQRRYKVLWTLYSTFAYILVALILTLVTGYQRWGVPEYSAIAGGPVLIYGLREALDAYYNFRLSRSQDYLNDLYKQREATIERLKAATKYNSTQQLLDKYGGSPRKRQPSPQPQKKRRSTGVQQRQSLPPGQRTTFAPPPTANIPRLQAGPETPPRPPNDAQGTVAGLAPEAAAMMQPQPQREAGLGEEFAPNAFSAPAQRAPTRQEAQQYAPDEPKWYDRILDVVLGEDETQAKNRIALICQNCRLVNGQAPPGARTLEDIGKWRCSSCHAWNGVESEEKKILRQVSGEAVEPQTPSSPSQMPASEVPMSAMTDPGPRTVPMEGDNEDFGHDDERIDDYDRDDDNDDDHVAEEPDIVEPGDATPAGSTRSKARQRKKA